MAFSKTKKRLLISVIILLVISLIAVSYYKRYRAEKASEMEKANAPLLEVTVSTVSKKDVPIIKEWVGTTQGDVNADIYAKVSGYLLKRNYNEGAVVQKDQVLFEIDPRSYQAAFEEATGNLEKAKANQRKSQADVVRYRALVKEGAVSQKEYTDAARTNDMNKAAVSSARATLEQAQLNLNWTKVSAPISGLAGSSIIQVGDLVDPSKKLTTVSVTDPIRVVFPISEKEYLWYQKMRSNKFDNDPSTNVPNMDIILSDGSIFQNKAEFVFADRQIEQSTGTISIQVRAANPNGFIRPGQYAKVRVQVGVFNDSVVIPRRAIIETQGTTQVAVVGLDNKVDIKDVKLGYIFDNNRIVEEGLNIGDRVVVEGFLKIKQGMLVNPKEETSVTK